MTPNKNILLYSPPSHNAGIRLQGIISTVVSWENLTIIQNIESLFHILRQPQNKVAVSIILASGETDMKDLISIRDLLHRNSIILILPDQEKQTITMGHVLRPRYLSYTNSDFSDVRDVLKKIVGKLDVSVN